MSTIATGRTTEDLVRIALSGASFWIKPTGRTTDDLVRIAAAMRQSGGQLTVLGTVGRTTEDLVRIGSAGKGHVTFAPSKAFFVED